MDIEEINDLSFSVSISKQLILNFLKGISLYGIAQYLEKNKNSAESIEITDIAINNIIDGYYSEEHPIQ